MPNVGGKKFPYTPEGMMAAKRSAVGMEKGGSPEAQSFIKSRIGDKIKNLAGVAIPGGSGALSAAIKSAKKAMPNQEGAAESQMILKLIQRMAQEEAETGAVKRGNMVAAMEADESGMSDRDMDLINQALGRGVTKSVRPTARGMMYGGEAMKYGDGGKATKRKVQKYKGGGCVMAGRGMKNTKMS